MVLWLRITTECVGHARRAPGIPARGPDFLGACGYLFDYGRISAQSGSSLPSGHFKNDHSRQEKGRLVSGQKLYQGDEDASS